MSTIDDSSVPQPRGGRRWKRALPLLGSTAMVSWLIWTISPSELAAAFQKLHWPLLVPLTLALVAAVYLWDSYCLAWLFRRPGELADYHRVLRARGTSYLFGVINWSFGQALLAWLMARLRQIRFTAAVGRCVVMAYIDVLVLLSVGLCGALISEDPRVKGVAVFCGTGLTAFVTLIFVSRLLPPAVAQWLRQTRLGDILELLHWRLSDLARLAGLRLANFSFGIAYVALALAISGFRVDHLVLLSVLPIVALLDGLPISVGGLGTRETALVLLLRPEQPAMLVALCFVWSGCMVLGRVSIGLSTLWHPETKSLLAGQQVNWAGGAGSDV